MKRQMKSILYVLLTISLMVSVIIGGLRIEKEQAYKEVQVAVHYSNIIDVARQMNQSVRYVLERYKEAGANTLFVRENTVIPSGQGDLGNLEAQGKAFVKQGYDLQFIYPNSTAIKGQYHYIKPTDALTYEIVYENLKNKGIGINEVEIEGEPFLELTSSLTTLTTVGVGFNYEDLITAAELGYSISPQVKSWKEASDESIMMLIEQIKGIPNLSTIYFADSEIVGYDHPAMIELVEAHGLGYVEFFSGKQKGFSTLAKATSQEGNAYQVVRLHTLTDNEAKKYTQQTLADRYQLALAERNLRVFLFKMPNTLNIEADSLFMEEAITSFTETVKANGYTIEEDITPLNLGSGDYVGSLLVGIAAIIVFILLMDHIGFTRAGYILGILGLIGYAGLLTLSPSLGLKLMSLFGAIIFPTYGVIQIMDTEPGSYKRTILAFLKVSAISFGGALIVVGTLSTTSYALGMDIFTGVKIAHLMPIVLVVLVMYYLRHGLDVAYYRDLLMTNINYLTIGLLGIAAVGLLIYTSRTGNSGSISELELTFRQMLDTVLGVRPRTKEFLIGHPIMVALIYFGYQEKYLLFLVLGIIGQISLVNTYAHIHTPLLISLVRSGYGILFGLVIGLVIIYGIKLMGKVINQWLLKEQ